MKVVVEFDLPEGQAIPDPRDIVRLTDPNWIADWWHIDDVKDCSDYLDEELSDEDAREVLRLAIKEYDSEYGINRDVIEHWVDWVLEQQAKVAV